MASYVPGFEHDLFISYAHRDDPAWAAAFEQSLRDAVARRLGNDVSVWQDERAIRAGDNWTDEINKAVTGAATFVAITSPSYQNSDWCTRERGAFAKRFQSQAAFESSNRFFIAVKTPWEDDDHKHFLPKIKPVLFFRAGDKGSADVEFVPGTTDFNLSLSQLAKGIAALLSRLRRQQQRVFVASPNDDCVSIWKTLGEELRADGYDVQPLGRRDASFDDELVQKEMDGSELSVHLLGSVYEPFAERQITLAADADHRLMFALVNNAEAIADAKQRALIVAIRDGRRPDALARMLPENWALLRDQTARRLVEEVKAALKATPVAVQPASGTSPNIYIIHDATTEEDTAIALGLKEQLTAREHMQVSVSRADVGDVKARHELLLRSCEAVLLCHKAAPARWLSQLAEDVIFAEGRFARQPFRSRAFLLPDPANWSGVPDLKVIPYTPRFQLADLEPFLAPLRPSALGHAGR